MIRFDQVTKLYRGAGKPALDAVSLEILRGEFVFLVGASGSGKSSFLRLVLREDTPTSGEIHVLGQRLATISNRKVPYFRRNLGVVFQDFRLLPNKTVYQNVAFTLQVIGKSRGFIQQAVPDVLELVGLGGKMERLPHELSGGEQQRVAIARAVVNKPEILLADEPTGNLDPSTSAGIMQVLQTINLSGTTVVMATHDVGIVDSMKRRVVELTGGVIIRDQREGAYTTSLPIITADDGRPMLAEPGTSSPIVLQEEEEAAPIAPASERTGQVEHTAPVGIAAEFAAALPEGGPDTGAVVPVRVHAPVVAQDAAVGIDDDIEAPVAPIREDEPVEAARQEPSAWDPIPDEPDPLEGAPTEAMRPAAVLSAAPSDDAVHEQETLDASAAVADEDDDAQPTAPVRILRPAGLATGPVQVRPVVGLAERAAARLPAAQSASADALPAEQVHAVEPVAPVADDTAPAAAVAAGHELEPVPEPVAVPEDDPVIAMPPPPMPPSPSTRRQALAAEMQRAAIRPPRIHGQSGSRESPRVPVERPERIDERERTPAARIAPTEPADAQSPAVQSPAAQPAAVRAPDPQPVPRPVQRTTVPGLLGSQTGPVELPAHLDFAARLGLRERGELPPQPESQEVGPTS